MKKLIIMGVLPVLAMAAPQVAMAGEGRSATVSYAGLDLTTEAGQDELKTRIERAARSVCSDNTGRLTAEESSQRAACMKVALKKSEQQYANIVSSARYGG